MLSAMSCLTLIARGFLFLFLTPYSHRDIAFRGFLYFCPLYLVSYMYVRNYQICADPFATLQVFSSCHGLELCIHVWFAYNPKIIFVNVLQVELSHFSDVTKGKYEPREKTGLLGFRPGPTQTRLHSDRRWLEA